MDETELRRRASEWRDGDPDAVTVAELDAVLRRGDLGELADRFGASLEFGTAGLRGVMGAGSNRMNRAVVRRTTAGLARYLKREVKEVSSRGVVIGWDGRRLSAELAEEAARVLAAEGIPALLFSGMVPTPLVAFATVREGAAAGVMITASHNPPEYNGYKVYWGNGAQIIPPHDAGIAAAIERVEPANRVPLVSVDEARGAALWRVLPSSVERAYLDAILKLRPCAEPADLRIVYTALHGVGGRFAVQALREAGFAKVHPVPAQQEPDGSFPTVRFPNPEEPGAMDLAMALAREVEADLVLANDPDADRLAVAVRQPLERGEGQAGVGGQGKLVQLSGNEVGVLLGHFLLTACGKLPGRPLVLTTIVSSAQLGHIARALDARYDETLTGFKWIANRAMERESAFGENFLFGYEEALGYTVGDVVRDKDGIGAALVFADLASWCRTRGVGVIDYLEEIQRRHGLFVGGQANFTFPGPEGVQLIARVMEGFRAEPLARLGELAVVMRKDYRSGEGRPGGGDSDGPVTQLGLPASNVLAYEFSDGSRVTLRPSGTEPKIKYYFELCETLGDGEAVATARARANERLAGLERAFLVEARRRGQPG